jgi:O-antigen/teichoic acid export membrane protein
MKKSFLTLFSGTTLAQLIPIIISPLLTRLYTPNEFGIFSFFSSIVFTAIILTTFRMEMAIILPKKHDEAKIIVKIIFLTTISMIVFLFLGYLIFNTQLNSFKIFLDLKNFIYFFPIAIFCFSMNQAYYYYSNRLGFFNIMAVSKIVRSSFSALLQLLFGLFNIGVLGLILGMVGSLLLSLLYFIKTLRVSVRDWINHISKDSFCRVITRYKNFPLILTPSSFLEAISVHMPIFLLTYYYSPYVSGLYALTQRVIQLPISVVATSVSDILRKKITTDYQVHGNARPILVYTMKRLFLFALVFTLALYFFSKNMFLVIFGDAWIMAGRYVEIMSVMIFMRIISNPIGVMFVIAEKQSVDFFIQVSTVVCAVVALFLGYYYYNSAEMSILFFSMVYATKFFFEAILAFYFGKRG